MQKINSFMPLRLIIINLFLMCLVDATIEVYDRFGQQVDSFDDREAPFEEDFDTYDGFLFGADPPNACSNIAPPRVLTNFSVGRFVLINGSDECLTLTKLHNADRAGYDVAIIFDAYPMQYHFPIGPFPKVDLEIEALFVSCEDGIILRDNYLYNNSLYYNYRVRIRPDRPDIRYYMYLFGGVIGVCFFVMLLFMMCLLFKCVQERRRLRRNRLSSRQIKQIPTAKFAKGDQYDVCAICLENFNEGDKLRILPCSHAYHAKCIDPWLMNNRRNCPLCKRKIHFGDSEDESDSEDSELTSPAENTPLLLTTPNIGSRYGTHQPDGSAPSTSARYQDECTTDEYFLTDDDQENLLAPPMQSVNSGLQNFTRAVVVNVEPRDDRPRGLSV